MFLAFTAEWLKALLNLPEIAQVDLVYHESAPLWSANLKWSLIVMREDTTAHNMNNVNFFLCI